MATATKTTTTSTRENSGTPAYPKSHPPGLWVLFATEMWERFCYYGMRAFLVLYLVSKSTAANPGLGWSEREAYNLYAIYCGLVYLMPLLGGWVADRFIGQHRSVFWGGVIMALGEFVLACTEFFRQGGGIPVNLVEDPFAVLIFYTGLSLMIVGTGFFKPCISVMVGQLYGKDDPRRDSAFTIFYMGINLGAFLAPLIAGGIAETIGWSYGFLVAGIGMIFGLITYVTFRPMYLKGIGMSLRSTADDTKTDLTPEQLKAKEIAEYERTRPLTRVDYDRMFVVAILVFFTVAFWTAFEQAGSTLNVFAKKETDRRVSTAVATTISSVAPVSMFLNNEFAQDLKLSIDEVARIHDAIANVLQKSTEQRKTEEEYRASKAKAELDAKKAKMAADGYLNTLWNEIFAKEKDKFLYDADGQPVSVDSLVKELLKRAEEITIPSRFVTTADPHDATYVIPQKLLSLPETSSDAVELIGKIPADTVLPNRLPAAVDEEDPTIVVSPVVIAPDMVTLHFCSLAGYHLSEDEVETLLANLKKYPAAKKQLDGMLKRTNMVYHPDSGDVITFPATWYQSVNALGIVVFAPVFAFLWVFLAARGIQPSTPVKFGIGLLLLSISFVVMVPGAVYSKQTNGMSGAHWLLWSYLFATWGELCLSPVGLSIVTKLSPARYASLMMGVWFLSSAMAHYLSGYLASVFGTSEDGETPLRLLYGNAGGMADFFVIMAVIPAIAGLTILVISPLIKRKMHGIQ